MADITALTPRTAVKISLNSYKQIVLTLFMMVLAYTSFTLGYVPAGIFFAIISIVFLVVVYKKIVDEIVRARFSEYNVDL